MSACHNFNCPKETFWILPTHYRPMAAKCGKDGAPNYRELLVALNFWLVT